MSLVIITLFWKEPAWSFPLFFWTLPAWSATLFWRGASSARGRELCLLALGMEQKPLAYFSELWSLWCLWGGAGTRLTAQLSTSSLSIPLLNHAQLPRPSWVLPVSWAQCTFLTCSSRRIHAQEWCTALSCFFSSQCPNWFLKKYWFLHGKSYIFGFQHKNSFEAVKYISGIRELLVS